MTSNYTILEKLHEGSETVVYRGIRVADHRNVVLKMPKNASPSPREVAKLIHQYEIIKDVQIPGIIIAYDMERYQDGARLVLEDFDGSSLQHILAERTFDLCDFAPDRRLARRDPGRASSAKHYSQRYQAA